MAHAPARIKIIAAAGVPAPDAIQAALPGSFVEFAERNGLTKSAVSMCIHGRQRHAKVRAALAGELGVEPAWLDALLDENGASARAA